MLLVRLAASALVAGWAGGAMAQDNAAATAEPDAGDIVVTARRVNENLQDVPMTVNAVTGEDLKKFNLFNGSDLSSVAPGLTLMPRPGQSDPVVAIRGTSKGDSSGAEATVQTYLNEAPISATLVYQSLFDIQQIEVLRGPQGTLRGEPASSGAITFTTARPNLTEIEANGGIAISDRDQQRLDGALSLPLISGKLAVRFAGVYDDNDNGGVRSVNSSAKPYAEIRGWRTSLRFQPIPILDINLMYQRLDTQRENFFAVGGSGYTGPGLPANYNGPALTGLENRAVGQSLHYREETYKTLIGRVDLALGDHHALSYVGSYQRATNFDNGAYFSSPETGNFFSAPLDENLSVIETHQKVWTHEIRFQSTGQNLIDYGVGFYALDSKNQSTISLVATYLPGAFGVGTPSLDQFNPYYRYQIEGSFPIRKKSRAIYANATLHISDRDDLFVGMRRTAFTIDSRQSGGLTGGVVATGAPTAFCDFIPDAGGGPAFPSTVRPGQCDLPLGDVTLFQGQDFKKTYKPWVFSGSYTHQFSDALTAYVSYGRSWRPGVKNAGLNSTDTNVTKYTFISPETSDNYEVGLKARLLDRKLAINLAAFRQDFKGYIYNVPFISYLSTTTGSPTVTTSASGMQVGADARVTGVDFDFSYRPSRRFYIGGSFNYARGRLKGQQIPCNDSNFDGVADTGIPTVDGFQAAGVPIALCATKDSISRNADWYASANAEYNYPVSDDLELYARTLSTYTPRNRYASAGFTSKAYALVDLFLGIRNADGRWDIGGYARNLFNKKTLLSRGADVATDTQAQADLGVAASTGYYPVSRTPRREFGVTGRFSF